MVLSVGASYKSEYQFFGDVTANRKPPEERSNIKLTSSLEFACCLSFYLDLLLVIYHIYFEKSFHMCGNEDKGLGDARDKLLVEE